MPLDNTDAYKLSHKGFMSEGVEYITSNYTARSFKYLPVNKNRFDNKAVVFSLQHFIHDFLIKEWSEKFFSQPKDKVITKYKRIFDAYLGKDSVPMDHFEELHDIGYLPILIKALPEGSLVPARVPFMTITNTNPKFAWITNYFETVVSCEIWKPMTVATIIRQFRLTANEFALETTGTIDGTEFQIHGFEFRGMSGRHDAAICSAAFLLSSFGTDTIPALDLLEESYGANLDEELVAGSVPATEHSLECLGIAVNSEKIKGEELVIPGDLKLSAEYAFIKEAITKSYPTGIVSLVQDGNDYFGVLTRVMPALRDEILSRKPDELGLAKVVSRPDSGIPEDILCGTVTKFFKVFEDAFAYFEEYHTDLASQDCEGFYNCGYDEYSTYCKVGDKYYQATTKFEYNRYDEKYYYIDNWTSGCGEPQFKEVIATPEMVGAVEILWNTFGGTTTEQGYKVLNERVGVIYGDSITLERQLEIYERLKAKGFASTNVVLGVGSYTSQYLTRDSIGAAIKATHARVGGVDYALSKDPKTDDGTKKSAQGLLRVEMEGGEYVLYDNQTREQEQQGELIPVFQDGVLLKEHTLTEIRERLWG